MKNQGSYVPPAYIPLGQSETEADDVPQNKDLAIHRTTNQGSSQWSSGICACCDDMQSSLKVFQKARAWDDTVFC
ncbi:hypothetical protein TorRG33x02_130820 [Trema orientale]|uniref:Uncharacterized protein n=1 Tax=Trema orientale TaxID=63057 RepID=A0A2P5EZV2_TREOI|nr:hypothetical protein TorRG33x02_130820 [Trema orientale]